MSGASVDIGEFGNEEGVEEQVCFLKTVRQVCMGELVPLSWTLLTVSVLPAAAGCFPPQRGMVS